MPVSSPYAPPSIRRQGVKLATLVDIIEEGLSATEVCASISSRGQRECAAAVHADWTRIAPTMAAVTAYAHAVKSHPSPKALMIVVSHEPTELDRAALDVVKDMLPSGLAKPKLILTSEAALDEMSDCIYFSPQHDDGDLMALVDFSNRLHDHPESTS